MRGGHLFQALSPASARVARSTVGNRAVVSWSGGAGHTAWATVCSGVLGAGSGQEDSVCLLRAEWMGAQRPDAVGLRGCC